MEGNLLVGLLDGERLGNGDLVGGLDGPLGDGKFGVDSMVGPGVGCLETLASVGDSVVIFNEIVSFAVGGLVNAIVGDKVGGGKVGLVVIMKGCVIVVVGDLLGLEDGARKGFGASVGEDVGG